MQLFCQCGITVSCMHTATCCLLVGERTLKKMYEEYQSIYVSAFCFAWPDKLFSLLFLVLQATGMIGASYVNFKSTFKEWARRYIPSHQSIFFLDYLILVVTLAMENRRMLTSSWGFLLGVHLNLLLALDILSKILLDKRL